MWKTILIFYLIANPIISYSQLTLDQAASLKLGGSFSERKNDISSLFSKKPRVLKSDFLNAYKIEFENIPFDYYGSANYVFQFVKDTLISLRISFTFQASEKRFFQRLLKSLIGDFEQERKYPVINDYSTLSVTKALDYSESNCVLTLPKEDSNYRPISMEFFGENYYQVTNHGPLSRIIGLSAGLGELHETSYSHNVGTSYNGCLLSIDIEIYNLKSQDLIIKEQQAHSYYQLIKEAKNEIALKSQNGVYYLPVGLNGVMTLEFVLDLGASDLFISPDVFSVLYKSGTIRPEDFIGEQSYKMADGTVAKSKSFFMHSVQIGDKILENIKTAVSDNIDSPLLLGQSAVKKLGSYKIDNDLGLLVLE